MKWLNVLLVAIAALSSTQVSGAVINHDAVVGFPQQSPVTGEEKSALRFKAFLHVLNGCAAFPAVDAAGNVGGGLKLGGSMSGSCSSSPGQVYVRSGWYNGRWAMMYAWYMPKDQGAIAGVGHRNDWECAVVWINNPDVAEQNIIAVSASAHGEYRKYNPVPSSIMDGDHPNIKYWANGVLTHATDTDDNNKGENPVLPLIHWHQLTQAARDTLNSYDFGSANVPFKDSNFNDNLAKAFI
ncbi:necrosis-inducing-like protein [Cladochytrium replicatum]|nr:necrosis-inducing-like protein [Cladochytrium replicatum]